MFVLHPRFYCRLVKHEHLLRYLLKKVLRAPGRMAVLSLGLIVGMLFFLFLCQQQSI